MSKDLGPAAWLPTQRATTTDMEELRSLVELQLAKRDERDFAPFLLHDVQFHVRIARAPRNPMLVRALDHLLARNLTWFVFFRIEGRLARYMLSHESIMQAIGARDLDAPEATAIAYVRNSITLLLSMFHEVQVAERSADSLIGSETFQQIQSGVNTAD